MYEILNRLNKIEGVNGSLLIGKDGIVVAADLGTETDENAVAAVGSQILSSLQGALNRMGMGDFRRFIITGSNGKVIMADASSVLLILLLDLDTNIGLAGVEVRQAIAEIREKIQM